ncbi:MAG: tetratricopeptide repeat protein [Proteobacteria bacterium]|nr:tetratricopeptide repeat protein [Pseudomonadota bacterium]
MTAAGVRRTLEDMKKHRSFSSLLLILAAGVALSACQTTATKPPVDPATALELNDEDVAAAMQEVQGPPLEVDDLAGLMSSYLSAIIADTRGDDDVASGYYRQILKQDPIHTPVRERAFSLSLAEGDITGALALVPDDGSMVDVSGQPMVQLTRFYKAVADGKMDKAYKSLDAAEATSPQLLLLQLARAYLDLNSGKTVAEAMETVRGAEISSYLVAFKYYHLGRLYESAGQVDDALVAYRNGQMVDPSSLFLTLALGELYERRGQVDKALEVYDSFSSLNPDTSWLDSAYERIHAGKAPPPADTSLQAGLAHLVFDFGTIMVGQQVFLTAQQFFQLAVLVDPKHEFANFYLGLLNEQAGRMDQAIVYYQKIPAGSPPYLSAQIRVAESIYADKNKAGAINQLKQLLKEYPHATALHRALAQMYYDMEDYKKAIEQYDIILKDVTVPEKRHAMLFFSRGASHERLRQFDQATADLEKALALLPDNPMILNYLGYMWADIDRNLEQAYGYIKRAIELRPDDGAIVDSLGWAYYKKGDYDTAVKYLEQATSLLPNDPTINAHLGDVYDKLGRADEARTQWHRALTIGPDRPEERRELEKKLGLKTKG